MTYTKTRFLLTCIILIVASQLMISCEYRALGDWDPIELSEDSLYFDEDGGQETIYCFNYSPCVHSIRDLDTDKYYYCDPDHMKNASAPGIEVLIKNDVISVSVETSKEQHRWAIRLWAGDASGSFRVYQNEEPDN